MNATKYHQYSCVYYYGQTSNPATLKWLSKVKALGMSECFMTANERQSVHSPGGLFDAEFRRFIPYTDRWGASATSVTCAKKKKLNRDPNWGCGKLDVYEAELRTWLL